MQDSLGNSAVLGSTLTEVTMSPHLPDTSLKYVDLNIALPKNRVRSSWLRENWWVYGHGNTNISRALCDDFVAEWYAQLYSYLLPV
jgi:hypothetical protein